MAKEKLTLKEKVESRHIKKPPVFLYLFLANLWKMIFIKKYKVHFDYKINPKDYKGPYIVVSNHSSRVDYLYTGIAFLPHRLNYVAGYNEFFRSHLAMVFKLLQIIPKKNFVPEIGAIRNISRILRAGGRIIIFPEGMNSITGESQPSAIGSGKLLKHFKVPVLMTHIKGGYLTNPKYCLNDRPGRVDVTISELFNVETLEKMTESEIQYALDKALYQNDYAWNKVARVTYQGHGELAKDMHTLLYHCPRCHTEFQMKGEGDTIECLACGNKASLNEYYDLIPENKESIIPPTPVDWTRMEREFIKEEIGMDPNYTFKEKVTIGMLHQYKYLKDLKTTEIVGEGELSISRDGLHYVGTARNEPFEFRISTDQLPTNGMCIDVKFFSTFVDGHYIEIYPERESVAKWLFVTEELHRANGGKWQQLLTLEDMDKEKSNS